MRIVFVVLVLLNLLAFAGIRGWLGSSAPEGEPERLSNQLNPDRIVLRPGEQPRSPDDTPVLPAPPAPAATNGAPGETANGAQPMPSAAVEQVCVSYGGLTEAQAEALLRTVLAGNRELQVEHKTSSTPSAWWVRIPPAGGREGAERRVAELRALGVTDLFVVSDPGPNQYAISLGLFKTEAKAEQHLAGLQTKRVRNAGIAARTTSIHRLELRGAAAAVDATTHSRAVQRSGATVSECTP